MKPRQLSSLYGSIVHIKLRARMSTPQIRLSLSSLLWRPTQLYLRRRGGEKGVSEKMRHCYSSLQLTYTFKTRTKRQKTAKARTLCECAFIFLCSYLFFHYFIHWTLERTECVFCLKLWCGRQYFGTIYTIKQSSSDIIMIPRKYWKVDQSFWSNVDSGAASMLSWFNW